MRNTDIFIDSDIWSCQNFSAGFCLFVLLPSQYDTKNNSEYIKSSFSIGYFERYANSKRDYLELLLSVDQVV